jgi:hypothetical protein
MGLLADVVKMFMASFPTQYTREAGFHASTADIGAVEYGADVVACGAATTIAVAANVGVWVKFNVPNEPSTLAQVAIEVTTAGAGGTTARIAVYDNQDSHGGPLAHVEQLQPWRLLAQSGDLAIDSTGLKSFAPSIVMKPGRIYWAIVVPTAAVTLRAPQVGSVMGQGWTVNSNALSFLTASAVAVPLPSLSPAPTALNTSAPPMFRLKFT